MQCSEISGSVHPSAVAERRLCYLMFSHLAIQCQYIITLMLNVTIKFLRCISIVWCDGLHCFTPWMWNLILVTALETNLREVWILLFPTLHSVSVSIMNFTYSFIVGLMPGYHSVFNGAFSVMWLWDFNLLEGSFQWMWNLILVTGQSSGRHDGMGGMGAWRPGTYFILVYTHFQHFRQILRCLIQGLV